MNQDLTLSLEKLLPKLAAVDDAQYTATTNNAVDDAQSIATASIEHDPIRKYEVDELLWGSPRPVTNPPPGRRLFTWRDHTHPLG